MKHPRIAVAVVFLVIMVMAQGILYVKLRNDYAALHSSFVDLEGDFAGLLSEYSELENRYIALHEDHLSISASLRNLTWEYITLRDEYQSFVEYVGLKGDYTKEREYVMQRESYVVLLREAFTSLQREYEIETTLRIGNSLESFYDCVRYEKGFIGSWRTDRQQDADFAAALALHDLGRNCWHSIENSYYKMKGEHSYEVAEKRIEEVIDLIGLRVYHTPTFKISQILQFIYQHIRFEQEVNNIYLAPIETLGFRSGDCDDFSILAAALFEAVGIDSAFGIFKNEKDEYHCMVLVKLDHLKDYGCWSYHDLTDRGLDAGTWIAVEPQYAIDQQNSDWIGELELVAASSLD